MGKEISEARKDELLRILFRRTAEFESDMLPEVMTGEGISKEEAEAYGVTWEEYEE